MISSVAIYTTFVSDLLRPVAGNYYSPATQPDQRVYADIFKSTILRPDPFNLSYLSNLVPL